MVDPDIVIPIAGMITGVVITLSVVSIVQYAKYKLKVEQIKADAAVRIEEMKNRHQAENEN